jgi:hypothetical protein
LIPAPAPKSHGWQAIEKSVQVIKGARDRAAMHRSRRSYHRDSVANEITRLRHCERSKAIQGLVKDWIASSLTAPRNDETRARSNAYYFAIAFSYG